MGRYKGHIARGFEYEGNERCRKGIGIFSQTAAKVTYTWHFTAVCDARIKDKSGDLRDSNSD